MVPFCPHLLQNLSPIAGTRSSRIDTLATLVPFAVFEIYVLSTNPCCPFFGFMKLICLLSSSPEIHDSLPIKGIVSSTFVFTSTTPYSPNLSFPPWVKVIFDPSTSLVCLVLGDSSSSSSLFPSPSPRSLSLSLSLSSFSPLLPENGDPSSPFLLDDVNVSDISLLSYMEK